jgi:hypothetical protein
MTLEELTFAVFQENLNSKFILFLDADNSVEIELIEARQGKVTPRQEMFSILFLGSNEKPFLQGLYPVEHAGLGKLDLFLVPVAQNEQGIIYEAVFNRMR